MPSTTRRPTAGATARSSTGKKPPPRPTSRRAAPQPPAGPWSPATSRLRCGLGCVTPAGGAWRSG